MIGALLRGIQIKIKVRFIEAQAVANVCWVRVLLLQFVTLIL